MSAAAFLNLVFNTSPYLKNCPIQRSIAAETRSNAVIFGSTSEQVDVVGRLIELLDQAPVTPDAAVGYESTRRGVDTEALASAATLWGVRRNAVPVLGGLPPRLPMSAR